MRISKRLFGPAQLGNSTATKYTTPANTKAIVRRIYFNNPTGGAVTVTFGIGADAAGTRLLDAFSIAAGGSKEFWGPITLEAGEIIPAHANAAASVVMLIDGEEAVAG